MGPADAKKHINNSNSSLIIKKPEAAIFLQEILI